MNRLDKIKAKYEKLVGELAMCKRDKKVEKVQAPPIAYLHRNLQAPEEGRT